MAELSDADVFGTSPPAATASRELSDDEVFGTSPPAAKPQAAPAPKQPPADNQPGFFSGMGQAAEAGLARNVRDVTATKAALTGGAPQAEADTADYAQPMALRDVTHPGLLARKFAYQTAYGLPEMAGGALGAIAGGEAGGALGALAGAPAEGVGAIPGAGIGAGVGAAVGTFAGSGLVGFAKALGPAVAGHIKAGADPDTAFNQAFHDAAQEGAFTGLSYAAFELAPFKSQLKNLTFQALGVQPALGVGQKAVENAEQGKPLTEGAADTAFGAAVGTALPAAAHQIAHLATTPAEPAASPELRNAAGAMSEAGQDLRGPSPVEQADQKARDDLANAAGFEIKTVQGTSIRARPELVELKDLITSHDPNGTPNPNFPHDEGKQPRDRTSVGSQDQVRDIAAKHNAEWMAPNPAAHAGAPIVSPENVVESGNGRTNAMALIYRDPELEGKRQAYLDWLTDQGYDITKMDEPLLISRRISEHDPEYLRQFIREANTDPQLAMNTAEKAKVDAQRAAAAMHLWQGNSVTDAANSDFVAAFMRDMPRTEAGGMMDKNGRLSPDGIRRIQSAVFAHAYSDVGPLLDKMLFGDTDGVKNIVGGLTDAAGPWSQMRAEAAAGRISPNADITRNIGEVLQAVDRARDLGVPLSEYLRQADLDRPPLSPEAEALLRAMFRDETFKTQANRQTIADRLKDYAAEAMKTSAEPDMFGTPPPSGLDIWKATERDEQGRPSQTRMLSVREDQEAEKAAQGAPTKGAAEARQRLATAAQAMMRYAGLPPTVGLKLMRKIVDAAGGAADGAYTRNLIQLALDTAPHLLPQKLWHETIHALWDPKLGLLSDRQRAALTDAANHWLRQNGNRDRLMQKGYKANELVEEAVARMGEQALARGLTPQNRIAHTYARIVNAVHAIGRALRGKGYQTADDVFRDMMQGKRASDDAKAAIAQVQPKNPVAAMLASASPAALKQLSPAVHAQQVADETPDVYKFSRRDEEQHDRVPLYSAVARAVDKLKQSKGSGDQFLAMLSKTPGVKPEEMRWLGLDTWLRGQRSVTRDQIADYVRAHQLDLREVVHGKPEPLRPEQRARFEELARKWDSGVQLTPEEMREYQQLERQAENGDFEDAKHYARYTLPGGENYREMVLAMPPDQTPELVRYLAQYKRQGIPIEHLANDETRRIAEGVNPNLHELFRNYSGDEIREAIPQALAYKPERQYMSSHWDEPNVLAHVRFKDRTDAEGRRVLGIEEIQSDWHQAGRREGYRDEAALQQRRAEHEKAIAEAQAAFDAAKRRQEEAADRFSPIYDRDWQAFKQSKDAVNEAWIDYDSPRRVLGNGAAERDAIKAEMEERYHELAAAHSARFREYITAKNAALEAMRDADEAGKRLDELRREVIRHDSDAVPDAPFKTTWPMLAMKRMIKWAVDHGYDRIAWMPGDENARRYPEDNGGPRDQARLAGMRGFYDKILPTETQKLIGKYGAKVGKDEIAAGEDADYPSEAWRDKAQPVLRRAADLAFDDDMKGIARVLNHAANVVTDREVHWKALEYNLTDMARNYIDRAGGLPDMENAKQTVHAFDITDELHHAVATEGLPLFSRRDDLKEIASAAKGLFRPTLDRFRHGIAEALFPMRLGSKEAQALASKFANTLREIMFRYDELDRHISRRFTPAQRTAMGKALDAQSVFEQQLKENLDQLQPEEKAAYEAEARRAFEDGKTGLAGLSEDQRAVVTALAALGDRTWQRMRSRGLVQGTKGLPFYMPRSFVMTGDEGTRRITHKDAIDPEASLPGMDTGAGGKGGQAGAGLNGLWHLGGNLTTSGPLSRQHLTPEESIRAAKAKFGDNAELVTDIRSLLVALSRNERAIAGRDLVDAIKRYGEQQIGAPWVVEGPTDNPDPKSYITLADHPALYRWQPVIRKDHEGNWIEAKYPDGSTAMHRAPIHISKDFAGPLQAVLSSPAPKLYRAMMDLKGAAMHAVMWSPLMHLQVEIGRSLPLLPGRIITGAVFTDGKRLLDAETGTPERKMLLDLIKAGLSPIGRGWALDPATIHEQNIMPYGRNLITRTLAQARDGFANQLEKITGSKTLGDIARHPDTAILWDNVLKLQLGLAKNLREHFMSKGFDEGAANIMAAHVANRYAGALPPEHLSKFANIAANLLLFSRSYTLGNLGVIKDMLNGAPSHVLAQIEQAYGRDTANKAQAALKAKARSAFIRDIGIFYLGNAMLQSMFRIGGLAATMGLAGAAANTFDDWYQKVRHSLAEAPHDPLKALRVLPQFYNEKGKKDRALIRLDDNKTGEYLRASIGKVGEDMLGWVTTPGKLTMNKLGTYARPALEILTGKDSLGRNIYNPDPQTLADYAGVARDVVGHLVAAQLPMELFKSLGEVGSGDWRKHPTETALSIGLPMTGLGLISHGYPGGPDMTGPQASMVRQGQDAVAWQRSQISPELHRLVAAGRVDEALSKLDASDLPDVVKQSMRRGLLNPGRGQMRQLRQHNKTATAEDQWEFEHVSGAEP